LHLVHISPPRRSPALSPPFVSTTFSIPKFSPRAENPVNRGPFRPAHLPWNFPSDHSLPRGCSSLFFSRTLFFRTTFPRASNKHSCHYSLLPPSNFFLVRPFPHCFVACGDTSFPSVRPEYCRQTAVCCIFCSRFFFFCYHARAFSSRDANGLDRSFIGRPVAVFGQSIDTTPRQGFRKV